MFLRLSLCFGILQRFSVVAYHCGLMLNLRRVRIRDRDSGREGQHEPLGCHRCSCCTLGALTVHNACENNARPEGYVINNATST